MKSASAPILTTLLLLGFGLTAGCAGNSPGSQDTQAPSATTQPAPAPASQPPTPQAMQPAPASTTAQIPPPPSL